jgi:hypothetical protein
MARYLTVRLLFLFLIKFFVSWAFHVKSQLKQFFNFNDGNLLDGLSVLLTLIILGLGIYTINLMLTIIHLKKKITIGKPSNKVDNNVFQDSIKTRITEFWHLFNYNISFEIGLEKYPRLFLFSVFIFITFYKGNPILNNYYGIYKEYEVEKENGNEYIENQNYIIHKSNKGEINGRMKKISENIIEDENLFKVKKRGYLFVQAGIIDGYKTYYKEYNGFISYLECLLFSGIEKLINTLMYFLLPFTFFIFIYHYFFDEEKTI